MKKFCAVLAGMLLAAWSLSGGAELVVTQDSITIEGGTYDMVDLSSRKYCTLRNVTVRNTTGTNYYAGIKLSGSKYITIENCTIDGGAATKGKGTCGGIKPDGASRVVIKGCKIYNLNDDGIRLFNSTLVDIIGNEIHTLRSCGTDGGCSSCNNGHSDGIQIIECIRVNVIGNVIHNFVGGGTSGIFMGNSGLNCKDIVISNNLLNTTTAYYTTYFWYVERFKVYNNVIWGFRSGGASIWYGINMWDFELCNNIISYVKFKDGGTYNAAEHTLRNNLFKTAFNYGSNNLQGVDPQFTTNPGATISPAMCALKSSSPCINKGMTGTNVPATDFYGNARNGLPDIGAIEYNGIPVGMREVLTGPVPSLGPSKLEVSPNPMQQTLTFEMAEIQQADVSLSVFNAAGKPVHKFNGTGESRRIIWNGLGSDGKFVKPGIYYYSMVIDGALYTGRVIKLK